MLTDPEQRIFDRLRDLDQGFTDWAQRGQDVVDYLCPSRTDIISTRNPGASKTQKIFDTTPTDALNKCAAGFMGYHTSQAAPWFGLATINRDLMEFPEIKYYLQQVVRTMQLVFHQANFYTMMHEFYIDLSAFGSACMWIGEDPVNYLYFKTIPFGQYRIAENHQGLVDVLYRMYQESARNLEQQFGKETLPDEVQKTLDDHNYDQKFDCVHAVWPRTDIDIGGISEAFKYQSAYYVCAGGGIAGGENIVSKSGFYEFPYAVARWSKDSSETYGRGPGIDNMPDIKTLQAQEKAILKAGQKAVDPPLDIPPGYRTAIRTGPAGLNFRAQGTEGIKPLYEFGQNIPIGADLAEQRRERIKKAFYNDVFMMLQNLEKGRMTIPELMERVQEKLIILGPVIGRLHHEATGPIIERSYAILARQFPPVLPALPEILKNEDIEIEYISPLAKAQRAAEMRTTMDTLNTVLAVTEVFPQAPDNVNIDEFIKEMWDLSGINQKLLNSPRMVQAIRQQRAQAAAAQAQKENLLLAAQVGETASKMGAMMQ